MSFSEDFKEKIKNLQSEEEVADVIKAECSDSTTGELDVDALEDIYGGSYSIYENTIECLECRWWYASDNRGDLLVHYGVHRALKHATSEPANYAKPARPYEP